MTSEADLNEKQAVIDMGRRCCIKFSEKYLEGSPESHINENALDKYEGNH